MSKIRFPLHEACARRPVNIQEICAVLSAMHDKNQRDDDGNTALTTASYIADPEARLAVIGCLLEAGLRPNIYNDEDTLHSCPLVIAICTQARSHTVVTLLLKHKADIFANVEFEIEGCDCQSIENTLFLAARCGYPEAACMILGKAKAENCISAITRLGTAYDDQTVENHAVRCGHPEFVEPYQQHLRSLSGVAENASEFA
jgi:hypothetical protein